MEIWKIAILTDDIPAARALYVDKLGMKVLQEINTGDTGMALMLDAGPIVLEIIPSPLFASISDLHQVGLHHMSFKVEDVDRTSQDWKSQGITVITEPFFPSPGIQAAFFEGGPGVILQLFQSELTN